MKKVRRLLYCVVSVRMIIILFCRYLDYITVKAFNLRSVNEGYTVHDAALYQSPDDNDATSNVVSILLYSTLRKMSTFEIPPDSLVASSRIQEAMQKIGTLIAKLSS